MFNVPQSPVANNPVEDEFKRKPRTISPDPILWARLTQEAKKERVPLVRLLDGAIKQFLDGRNSQ